MQRISQKGWDKMRKSLLISLFFFTVLWNNVYANCSFQTGDVDRGILKVAYTSSSGKKAKLIIEKGDSKYTYNLNCNGKTESFPLQLGSGAYKATVLENISGNSYRIVDSAQVMANMSDEKAVYLGSIQNIDWNRQNQAIKFAVNLTSSTSDIGEKARLLYSHIVNNYKYDYNKLASLPTTYLPNIDTTYQTKTGICYDFSSLFASMLRSQGIYAKLVKGYTPNATGYHAWNEVYDQKTKSWLIVDTTYDLQVIKKKKITMSKKQSDYQKVYEY